MTAFGLILISLVTLLFFVGFILICLKAFGQDSFHKSGTIGQMKASDFFSNLGIIREGSVWPGELTFGIGNEEIEIGFHSNGNVKWRFVKKGSKKPKYKIVPEKQE